MKIDDNTRRRCNFAEIEVGQCFVFNGEYFMKTQMVDTANGDFVNGVNLNTGVTLPFGNLTSVCAIGAEVKVISA